MKLAVVCRGASDGAGVAAQRGVGLRSNGHVIPIKVTQLCGGEKLREELVDAATETLHPTAHPKIGVIEAAAFDQEQFRRQLQLLEEAARRESAEDVLRILQEFDFGFRPAAPQPLVAAEEKVLRQAASAGGRTLAGLFPRPGRSP